ncbi:MAG TPA: glycosyltransferase family 39 protein, partial [Blastocatellia bacterium]
TPGMLWLNSLLMKLAGASLVTVAAGLLVFKIATLTALFYAGRRLSSNWLALLPVGLTLCWIGYKYIFGVYPTQYSLLFALAGLIAMLRYDETGRKVWLFGCGLAVGGVFVFKYNVGILLVASVTAIIAIKEMLATEASRRARILTALKKAMIFWAGFAAVFLAMCAYLAYQGALGAMIDHFLHHVRAYSEERAVRLPHPKQLIPMAGLIAVAIIGAVIAFFKARKFFEAYLVASLVALASVLVFPGRAFIVKNSALVNVAYLPIFLFAVTLIWVVVEFRKKKSEWWKSAGPLIMTGFFALGVYMEVYPRADYYHLVRVLPAVFLLLLILTARITRWLESRFENLLPAPRRAALLCAAVPLALLAIVGFREAWQPQFDSAFRLRESTPLQIERARGMLVTRRQAEMIENLARLIEENSAADDYIFSFAQRGTAFHFLTGRRNPTRFVWWRSVGIRDQNREEAIEMIRNRVPKLIILQDALKSQRIRDTVAEHYTRVGAVDGLVVFSRKSDESG